MTMIHALKSSVITALGILLAVFAFVSRPGLEPRSAHSQGADQGAGAVLFRRAIEYDVSRPLALMQESNERTALANGEGAAFGASPSSLTDDLDAAQERRDGEPIPPLARPPILSPAGIAVEQTSQGTRPAVPLLESFDGL